MNYYNYSVIRNIDCIIQLYAIYHILYIKLYITYIIMIYFVYHI